MISSSSVPSAVSSAPAWDFCEEGEEEGEEEGQEERKGQDRGLGEASVLLNWS